MVLCIFFLKKNIHFLPEELDGGGKTTLMADPLFVYMYKAGREGGLVRPDPVRSQKFSGADTLKGDSPPIRKALQLSCSLAL